MVDEELVDGKLRMYSVFTLCDRELLAQIGLLRAFTGSTMLLKSAV